MNILESVKKSLLDYLLIVFQIFRSHLVNMMYQVQILYRLIHNSSISLEKNLFEIALVLNSFNFSKSNFSSSTRF